MAERPTLDRDALGSNPSAPAIQQAVTSGNEGATMNDEKCGRKFWDGSFEGECGLEAGHFGGCAHFDLMKVATRIPHPSEALYAAVAAALHVSGNTLNPLKTLVRPYITDAEAQATFDELIDRLFKADTDLRNAATKAFRP